MLDAQEGGTPAALSMPPSTALPASKAGPAAPASSSQPRGGGSGGMRAFATSRATGLKPATARTVAAPASSRISAAATVRSDSRQALPIRAGASTSSVGSGGGGNGGFIYS